jgi:hypothetical protein
MHKLVSQEKRSKLKKWSQTTRNTRDFVALAAVIVLVLITVAAVLYLEKKMKPRHRAQTGSGPQASLLSNGYRELFPKNKTAEA